eukprot:scaffold277019_cov12-Tisochrysis_lutea.AAC.1
MPVARCSLLTVSLATLGAVALLPGMPTASGKAPSSSTCTSSSTSRSAAAPDAGPLLLAAGAQVAGCE